VVVKLAYLFVGRRNKKVVYITLLFLYSPAFACCDIQIRLADIDWPVVFVSPSLFSFTSGQRGVMLCLRIDSQYTYNTPEPGSNK